MLCLALDCLVISVLFLVLVREPPRGTYYVNTILSRTSLILPRFLGRVSGGFFGISGSPAGLPDSCSYMFRS